MDPFDIDTDDDIFFELPEEDVDFSELDWIGDDLAADTTSSSTTTSTSTAPKKAKATKKSAENRLQCPHCPKTYANERTLKTHMNAVLLKDISRRAPDVDALLEAMKDLSLAVLLDIQKEMTLAEVAQRCSSYSRQLADFISNSDATPLMTYFVQQFDQSFNFKNVALLSKLHNKVTIATNELLNSPEFRKQVKALCCNVVEFQDGPLNFFIGKFVLSLSYKVLIFSCQSMRSSAGEMSGPRKRSKDDFSSLQFKKLVHYIGGSVVAGVKRRTRNYPTAANVLCFAAVVENKFVEDKEDPDTWCDPAFKEWTAVQNRGGLCFISKNAFDFFMELIPVILCHEEDDGAVLLEKVHLSVQKNFKLLDLWDTLVGESMAEDACLEWLMGVVDVLCRCVSKGIIKRRLNEALKKPTSNVAHRSKLARN